MTINKKIIKTKHKKVIMNKTQKGFTLLELLIVIAILAVLATVAVLVINPVEYLRQARDSQRIGDLSAVKGALDLYLTTAGTPDLTVGVAGNAARCMVGIISPFTLACSTNATQVTDGTGWVLVNLGLISGGSPLAVLPKDPTNNATYFYAYAANEAANTYELDAKLESTKFATDLDIDGNDGGSSATWYEIGNDPGLDL